MVYVIKIRYNEILRRLTLPTDNQQQLSNDDLTFAKLEGRIRELFQLPNTAELVVTYVDRDSDIVTMVNDQDVMDALVHQALNPLRLNVSLAKPKDSQGNNLPKDGNEESTSTDGADIPLKELLRMLTTSTTESVKQVIQACEPLKDVKSPNQIPSLVENILQTLGSQVSSAVELGMAAASSATKQRRSDESSDPSRNQAEDVQCAKGAYPERNVEGSDGTRTNGISINGGGVSSTKESCPETNTDARVKNGGVVNSTVPVHYGVTCDVCGVNPIVGVRWKSNKLYDFDLCPSCFEQHGNGEDFTKIEMCIPFAAYGFGPMRRPPSMESPCPFLRPHFRGGRGFGMRGRFEGGLHRAKYGKYLDARFVRDVTMFDGTEVVAGTHFTKIWCLRNSGTLPWPAHTNLVQVSGADMGNVSMVPLEISKQGVHPEGEIDVSIDLVAPENPGRYISHWQLVTPSGYRFGHSVWVLVQVVAKEGVDQCGQETPAANTKTEDLISIATEAVAQLDDSQAVVKTPAVGDSDIVTLPIVENNGVQPDDESHAVVNSPGNEFATLEASATKVEVDITSANKMEDISSVKFPEGIVMLEIPTGGVEQLQDEHSNITREKNLESTPVEAPPVEEGPIAYPVVEVPRDEGPIKYPAIEVNDKRPADQEKVPSNVGALLAKLTAMGFTDTKLNVELLEKNKLDLRATLDDLCAIEEWDPILEELVEMGFYDSEVNRRLMFKNKGSVKHVVKELVQMYKDQQAN